MRDLTRDEIATHAAAVLDSPPPLTEWRQGRDRCVPHARWVSTLRKAGWPVATVEAMLPQHEHSGPRAGQRVAEAAQPITVVPGAMLRELARRLDVAWGDACRYILPDDPRPVGRPKTKPADHRIRSIRLDDAEYAAVMRFIQEFRAAKTA